MTVSSELDRRFRDAAGALGLIDLGFDVVDSPIGPLFVAASERGLAAISFDSEPDDHLDRLTRIAGPAVLRSPKSVDRARRELDEYFAGRRRAFDLSLDLRALPPFTVSVLEQLAQRSLRRDDDVRRTRRSCRPAARGTRCRHRDEPQPDPDRPPVPPRRRRERRPGRLRRRARHEARPAPARRRRVT